MPISIGTPRLVRLRSSQPRHLEDEETPMRRMKRRANGKKKSHAKKRHNPSSRKHTHARRRRRRNDESAAPKKARARRSVAEKEAALLSQLEKVRSSAAKEVAKAEKKAKSAEKRAASASRKAEKAKRSTASKGRRLRAAARRAKVSDVGIFGEPLTPAMAKYLSTLPAPKGRPRKGRKPKKQLSRRAKFAKLALQKGSKASKTSKSIARAWKAAKRAQAIAKSPREQRLVRAMGLAGVPNPGMGGMFKDISALLPQMGVSAVALAVAAVAGQMVASKVVPADKQDSMIGKAAPSLISLSVGLAGYMALRKSAKMGKFAPWVLAGGVAAAAVHAIARITVKDSAGAPVSLGKRLGLPIGEYASMAGYGEYASMAGLGEYASMAGGTAYAGSRGVFSGLDDTDPVLNGTDDEDEVDMIETHADEGDNTDEGSLNGSIFD